MWMMTKNVCCLCGYKGKIKELVWCVECEVDVSAVHRYCKGSNESETAGWTCDDCLEKKMTKLKEQSRKSIRVQDRWVKRSNYKMIHKPKHIECQGGGLDNFQYLKQYAMNFKTDKHCNAWYDVFCLNQMKACFRCGLEGSGTDLIDCGKCHSYFVHRKCKEPQENRSPKSDWMCENCKKSMQLIHQSPPIKITSRIRAGRLPSNKLSDKPKKLGFQDHIFRKEAGVRLSEHSNHGMTGNKQSRTLIVDDNYSTTKATRGFQNAQYMHRKVELGDDKSLDRNRGSDHGKATSRNITAQAKNLQSTSFQHYSSNHVENVQKKPITDYSDIFGDDDQRASLDISSDKIWASDHGRGSKKLVQPRVDHAATEVKNMLSQVARDWPQNFRHRNNSSLVNRRGQIDQPLEPMDQCIKGDRHDGTGIRGVPIERKLKYIPAEPIVSPVWKGLVCIHLGQYRTDMELSCHLSTNCSSNVAEAVKGFPNPLTFVVKCRPGVWPRRFQMSPLSDEAIAVYFFPKNEKDVVAYDEMLGMLLKYDFALMYEVPSKNQSLLIFPSSILPAECLRLQRKSYMWGTLKDTGDE